MKKIVSTVLALLFILFLLSFTVQRINNDFLKALGISQTEADKKITNSLLGGYLDSYGLKNAKNIATGNRTAVVNDLMAYSKKYVTTPAFKKEYATLKASHKPEQYKVQTPEELFKSTIEQYKKSVVEAEGYLKKSDATSKPIFENLVVEAKKMLKNAEDPNNKEIQRYTKGYPELVRISQESYDRDLQKWEENYPANELLFIKKRLVQFLDETKDIDFAAETTVKNGKKVFVNPAYERKGNRWKMAYRAGKEVVAPARTFVEQWLAEIN